MNRRLATGTMYLAASSIIFMLSGYLTNIFLGRHLGPATYGIYGVLTALMTALNIMQVSGIPQAVSKFAAENEKDADSVLASGLRIQLLLTTTIGLLLLLVAPFVATVFNNQSFIGYTRAIALVFPLYGIFALYTGYYNGLHLFKKQAAMNSIYSLSKLFLVIVLAIEFGLYGAIAGFILSPLISLLYGFKFPRADSLFPLKKLALYSIPLIGYAFLATLQLSIDLFTLKAIIPDENTAGYYTAAQSIALIPYLSMSAIGQVLFPSISKFISTGEFNLARETISRSLRYLCFLVIPIAALMAATAPSLIKLLYGEQYIEAVTPLRILLVGYVLLTFFATFANILNGAGRANLSMKLAALSVTIGFITCILLIPDMGTKGAALGTTLGSCIGAGLSAVATYRIFRFKVSFISMLRITTGSALVFLCGWLITIPTILLPLTYIVLGIIYIILLHLIGEINAEDRNHFKKILPTWLPITRWL
jgi:O-antigen/teichoic acid export membrane protein